MQTPFRNEGLTCPHAADAASGRPWQRAPYGDCAADASGPVSHSFPGGTHAAWRTGGNLASTWDSPQGSSQLPRELVEASAGHRLSLCPVLRACFPCHKGWSLGHLLITVLHTNLHLQAHFPRGASLCPALKWNANPARGKRVLFTALQPETRS